MEKNPESHSIFLVLKVAPVPSRGHFDPAGQSPQLALVSVCGELAHWPVVQALHDEVVSWYLPAGHGSHDDDPLSPLIQPSGQLSHADPPSSLNVPALHSVLVVQPLAQVPHRTGASAWPSTLCLPFDCQG